MDVFSTPSPCFGVGFFLWIQVSLIPRYEFQMEAGRLVRYAGRLEILTNPEILTLDRVNRKFDQIPNRIA